jgi:beta-lactamase regulating signal transducer with metallopeptidase domain
MTILFISTVLINALWQPAVIATITWVVLRLSRCSNATTRHAVWTFALIASVVLPFVSAAPLLFPKQPTDAVAIYHLPAHITAPRVVLRSATPVTLPVALPSRVTRPNFHVQPTLAQTVVGLWSLAALLILGRLAFSFLCLERLKRDALPLSVEARHALTRWDRAEKGVRDVRVCVTHEISVPVAVGIFDAMILLPEGLVEELDATDLDRVLLHELAHVRRSDDWVNLFERVALALFFFSPGVYWIARQMDLEREVACDDWVLVQAAETVPYARCLTRIVNMTQWPHRAVSAPGVFVTRKSMSIRIERLLARGRDIRVRPALVPSLISLVAIAAIVIAGGFVSPTIAYTMQATTIAMKRAAAPKPSPPHAAARARKPATAAPTAPPSVVALTLPTPMAARRAPTAAPAARAGVHRDVTSKVDTHVATNANANVAVNAAQQSSTKPEVVADAGYLDEIESAGLKNLTADEVIELKSVGVTGDYVRALRDAGFTNLTPQVLVELKSVGVTPEYAAQLRKAGINPGDARVWVELKSVGVTPDYVAQMRSAGVSDGDLHALVELKSVGVTPDYVAQMRTAGLADATVRDFIEMKSVGVTPDYVRQLAALGYPHLTSHEYGELRAVGVTPDYIRNLARHGFTNLSVHRLTEFKAEGIEPQ